MSEFGVHSEVGRLRKVMVHRPDLSMGRLTPSNHDDLLFDVVLWVERAQQEHDAFRLVRRLNGRERWLIPILMSVFALGGTTFGMAEESLAFYVLVITVSATRPPRSSTT